MFASTAFSDLLQEFDSLRRHVDQTFRGTNSTWGEVPPVNIYTNDEQVLVTAEIPGVDPESLEISAYRDTLTIKGERKLPALAEGEEWHRRERRGGRFTRTLRLPYQIDSDSVEARARDGILAVVVKRPEADKPRRISVTVH